MQPVAYLRRSRPFDHPLAAVSVVSVFQPSRPALERVHGIVRLVRPLNMLLFWAGVVLGGLLTAGLDAFEGARGARLLLAALSASLIGGAANSLNDYFDLEIDRVNRPRRPLPAGVVSPREAWWVWAIGSGVGVCLSVALSAAHLGIAALSVLLCYLYSARLKGVPFAGNLVIAFVTPLALIIYGGWAVGPPAAALAGAAFAFATTLVREIVKDVEDAGGDALGGMRTFPLVAGPRAALRLAALLLVLTIAATPVPFLYLGYGDIYLLVVLFADVLLLYALWCLSGPEKAGRASAALKAAMFVGILALALAKL